jgi:hypothetical protein
VSFGQKSASMIQMTRSSVRRRGVRHREPKHQRGH